MVATESTGSGIFLRDPFLRSCHHALSPSGEAVERRSKRKASTSASAVLLQESAILADEIPLVTEVYKRRSWKER